MLLNDITNDSITSGTVGKTMRNKLKESSEVNPRTHVEPTDPLWQLAWLFRVSGPSCVDKEQWRN